MSTKVLGASALYLLFAFGCDEGKERPSLAPAERSQVIEQKGTPAVQPAATTTPSVATPTTPKPRRALCGGHLETEGKPAPKKPISRMAASGEPELTQEPMLSGGFTWVNFWAAWCVPCREEIPRLMGWQKKLTGSGKTFRLHFISVDDDERQLRKFLDEQPTGGLRSTYWLKRGQGARRLAHRRRA